jgi:MFS family permease
MLISRHTLLPADLLTRRLATATLVNTFGNGLLIAVSALFFTRVVGLSIAQVGIGLTVAGSCGVVAGVPIGRLADVFGTKLAYAACVTVEALGLCSFPLIHSFATFLPVACIVQMADRGGGTVRNALIAVAVPLAKRSTTRAYLRAVTNFGIGAGAAVAALALQADTRAAYLTMVLLDAATFVAAAVLMSRLPYASAASAPSPAEVAAGPVTVRRALADRPYLAITALSGIIAMQFAILEVGLPLWVTGHTHAPRIIVSAALLINTVLVVVFQVPAARGLTTPTAAARGGVRATALLGVSCLLYGAAAGTAPWLATALVVGGVVVGALGEVISSAAGWTLSYDLADQRAPGLYQGVFQTGFNAGAMLSPLLLTSVAIRFGLAGWAALGVLFLIAGLALVPVTRWALREHAGPTTPSLATP